MGCSRPLIVTDGGIYRAGLVDRVEAVLKESGITWAVFTEVQANPTTGTVDACLSAWLDNKCDAFLAIGGGSSIDTAKGAAILAANGGAVWDYHGLDLFSREPIPLVAIPTTAGTGSEVSTVASIVDTRRHLKLSIRHSRWGRARTAILDPDMLTSLPAQVAIITGIDALTHNIEAYTSRAATPFSDAFARQGFELISSHIRRFVADRQDGEAAGAMLAGSSMGAIAFSAAGTGNVHCLARFLVPTLGIDHGLACAVALPHVIDFNWRANPERYARVAAALGEQSAPSRAAAGVRRLLGDLGLPSGLKAYGLGASDIQQMAQAAAHAGYEQWNPRPTGVEGFQEILTRMTAE